MQVWGSVSPKYPKAKQTQNLWEERPLKDHQVGWSSSLWALEQDLGLTEGLTLH